MRFGSEAEMEPAQLAFEVAHFLSLRESKGSLSVALVRHAGLSVTSVTSVTDAGLTALSNPPRVVRCYVCFACDVLVRHGEIGC